MNEEAQAQAQAQNVNLWEDNALKDALIRLGLTDIGARKFMEMDAKNEIKMMMTTPPKI
jgi:hypothetical protein